MWEEQEMRGKRRQALKTKKESEFCPDGKGIPLEDIR